MKNNSPANAILLGSCSTKSLSSYLKAFGVFRLLANPSNCVRKAAADSAVKGFWSKNLFSLHSSLDDEGLLRFFLEDYAPSPIIAPWNGGSGFFPSDNKTAFNQLSKTDNIAERFLPLQEAIQIAEMEIKNRGLSESPKEQQKFELISALRAAYPEYALGWLDAVLAFHSSRLSFPPLLGTGGNDGRLDFTNNFMQRLVCEKTGLFDIRTGKAFPDTEKLLRNSLFGETSNDLFKKVPIGQFSPGSVGGQNSTSTGFEGSSSVNPWDFILTLEGTIMFAGAATRRHKSTTDSGASFPFMVKTVGSGHGSISGSDETKSRAEFWAPLWRRPASFEEIISLLKEGRAVLRGKNVRNGLDFARAASSLGINRGVECFERYGFLERSGKAYLSVSLGQRKVSTEISDAALLIEDLDAEGWLDRVRRFARKTDSSSARNAIRKLEDSLFKMTAADSNISHFLQNTLVAIGDFVLWLARSEALLDEKPPPPPRLSSEWIRKADDGTYEYRIASALASIGWRKGEIPMAAHFAPVSLDSISKRIREWDPQSNKRFCVLASADIISGLVAVLQRRLIEQNRRNLDDKPLHGTTQVNWQDISAFLSPDFNYARCKKILCGLVWAYPAGFLDPAVKNSVQTLPPFPYAALKPIFTPDKYLEEAGLLLPNNGMPVPCGIVSQLRGNKVDNAVRMAFARARASGIDSPFNRGLSRMGTSRFVAGVSGNLLAASMMIPLRKRDLNYIAGRAYNIENEAQNM